eukprot:850608_1
MYLISDTKLLLSDHDFITAHDEDYAIDLDDDKGPNTADIDLDDAVLIPPPISNVFVNHPHFNTANSKIFDAAMQQYIHSSTMYNMSNNKLDNHLATMECPYGKCVDDCMVCNDRETT